MQLAWDLVRHTKVTIFQNAPAKIVKANKKSSLRCLTILHIWDLKQTWNFKFDNLFYVIDLEFKFRFPPTLAVDRVWVSLHNHLSSFLPGKLISLMQLPDFDSKNKSLTSLEQVIVLIIVPVFIFFYFRANLKLDFYFVLLYFALTANLKCF